MAAALTDFRALLRAPGALAPVAASALGRFPIAMFGLALLLYVQRASGSFAAAGLVSACALAGVSVGSVVKGRLMDRVGPSRPLLVAAGTHAIAVAALVLAVERTGLLPLLMVLSALAGVTMPALAGASRALWADLVPAGPPREAAYTYEAVSLEIFFILGPAVAALLMTTPWAGTGLASATTAMVLGTVSFALTRAVRERVGHAASADLDGVPRNSGRGLGALASQRLRTIALASLGFGVVVGCVEVGVPAATTTAGRPGLAGLLLSLWSVTSVLAGLLYALRPWPRPMHLRIPALLAVFGLVVAAMAPADVGGGMLGLAAVMMLAGCLITPQVTGHSAAVELATPAGTATEAWGWVITAATLGLATGQSAAGVLVEVACPPAAFLAGGAAGLALAAVLWARRATLASAAARAEPQRCPTLR